MVQIYNLNFQDCSAHPVNSSKIFRISHRNNESHLNYVKCKENNVHMKFTSNNLAKLAVMIYFKTDFIIDLIEMKLHFIDISCFTFDTQEFFDFNVCCFFLFLFSLCGVFIFVDYSIFYFNSLDIAWFCCLFIFNCKLTPI